MPNINMIRIETKVTETFSDKIDLTDCSEENKLNIFRSRSIAALAVMMACGIDSEIAAKSITDGYHDLGIDAIYCDELQKKLVLVQSKWRNDGTGGISNDEILTFIEGIKRIITLEFQGANSKIQQKITDVTSAIKNMDYQVECIFCHTGDQAISDFVMRPIKQLLSTTNDESNEILKFTEYKQSDLFKYLASGQESDNISIDDVVLLNWGILDEPYKAYYGILPAAALADWYAQYGNKLFAKNIRYYKGNTDVNQGIRRVLKEEPENFFYYNNGIKMLCNKITRKAAYSTTNKTGLFALDGVSLVNGAQTTGAISMAFMENPEQVARAFVFVQLIDLENASDDYALQITRLSNTQNRIDSKEFAALDSEQERLKVELMFSGINYFFKSGAQIGLSIAKIKIDRKNIPIRNLIFSDIPFGKC